MTTEVIVLAQGTQKRLGLQHGHKELLRLPSCGVGILHRTLRQIAILAPHVHVTLVGWRQITGVLTDLAFPFGILEVELPDPGNSSLKGIARYLEASRAVPFHETDTIRLSTPSPPPPQPPHHTVVLLGDVVYSWSCLEAIWRMTAALGFVGTANISESAGELWGAGWARIHEDAMLGDLRDALLRHPPFSDEYQPGQLRRWIMGWRRGTLAERVRRMSSAKTYEPIDDYTMDVDLPQHLPLLDRASQAAAEDDARHGLTWETVR